MTIFKKLLITLIFILIIEIILIYVRYKLVQNENAFDIHKPKNTHTIMVNILNGFDINKSITPFSVNA